jgi:peptidoglycan/LPS O-acetylase OafA/YrhL
MSNAINIVFDDINKIGTEFPSPAAPVQHAATPVAEAVTAPVEKKTGRLLFIDGMRGVAAVLVMFFHFYSPKVSPLYAYLHGNVPNLLEWIFMQGYVGVEIFFVLSGFVIAYTLRNEVCTPGYALNFMLRRSIRLDPPYWTLIAVTIGYRCILWHQYTGLILHSVGIRNFLLNMFYLTNEYHPPLYVGVAWTLCLEVRFYLSFMIMLVIAQLVRQLIGPRAAVGAFVTIFAPLTIFSVFWRYGTGELTFLGTWYMFAMGVTLALAITKKIRERWLWILLIGAASGELWVLDFRASIAAGTVLLIYLCHRSGNMSNWLSWGWVQYLGKISYSLYLCHIIVGLGVMEVFLNYGDGSTFLAVAAYIAAAAFSIMVAQALHKCVEEPCINLAKLLKPSRNASTTQKPVAVLTAPALPGAPGTLVAVG